MIEFLRAIVELALLFVMGLCVWAKLDLRLMFYVGVIYLAFVIRSNKG